MVTPMVYGLPLEAFRNAIQMNGVFNGNQMVHFCKGMLAQEQYCYRTQGERDKTPAEEDVNILKS